MVLMVDGRKKKNVLKKYILSDMDINKLSIKQRYLIFILFCIYIIACVGIFFNWISLSDFFYNGNIYLNNCEGENVDTNYTENQKYKCEEQDKKVQSLYPIIICSNFIMSSISGIFFDYCGPKITAAIGHSFNILSWILIGLQKSGNNTIFWGAIFLGLSCDSTLIPILSLIYLFPSHHTIYTVVLGCCASLSFAVPMFLEFFIENNNENSFQLICFLYCGIILIPFFLVLIIFLPLKHIYYHKMEEIEQGNNTLQELANNFIHNDVEANKLKSFEDINNNEKTSIISMVYQKEENDLKLTESDNNLNKLNFKNIILSKNNLDNKISEKEHENNSQKACSSDEMEKKDEIEEISKNSRNILTENNVYISRISTLKKKKKLDDNIEENFEERKTQKKKFNIYGMWKEIEIIFFSLKYISICYYFTIYNLSLVNYNQCAKLFFKDYNDIQNLLKLFGPLSVFPCALLGFLVEKLHIFPIIFMLLASEVFMYMFAVLKSKIFAYFSSFFYLIVTGCYTTQLYCYVQIMFPKYHFGKVVGTTSMLSGVLSLLNIPIYNYFIVDYNNSDPNPFAYIVIGLLTSTFPFLFIIYRRCKKKTK